MTQIQITTHQHHDGLPMPFYATLGSAGMDIPSAGEYVLHPGKRMLVATGLAIALPDGYEAQIRPRSGLAAKHGVILINHGQEPFTINRGDRIAQLVVAQVEQPEWVVVDELPATQRGDDGFGSSGINQRSK